MIYEDYIITEQLDLDLPAMNKSCDDFYELVKISFTDNKEFSAASTASTKLFQQYNLLMYPYSQFYELYQNIKTVFRKHCDNDEPYYIQAWLNYYQNGEYIDWHSHWDEDMDTWHGFYCVNTESAASKTTYRLPFVASDIDVVSKDNLIVLSKSEGDLHRTWPWTFNGRPRITIAFDIVPAKHIDPTWVLNHWIPL
jgi:hypothetical protein